MILIVIAVSIPVVTGFLLRIRNAAVPQEIAFPVYDVPRQSADNFHPLPLDDDRDWRPRVTNVNIVDLDNDALADLLVCDAVHQAVWWHRQTAPGQFEKIRISDTRGLAAPCHTSTGDLDSDGDIDVAVAVLRSVWPTDRRVGQVVMLENEGNNTFRTRIILDDLRRVTDVEPADLDGDGDLDLAVAEFGYLHGGVLWLENDGQGGYIDHRLLAQGGATHVAIADFDADGDPDLAVVMSQDEEEVLIFENDGRGQFRTHRVWQTVNFDLGSAGMVLADPDSDGDPDLVLSAGDNLEFVYPCAQPYHGCYWLENEGDFVFREHLAAKLPGCYASAVGDLDGDGDQDIVCGSMFADQRAAESPGVVWLQNDGTGHFDTLTLPESPSRVCTVSCGDLNQDGLPDIAAGSLQIFEPFDDSSGVTIWLSGEAPE